MVSLIYQKEFTEFMVDIPSVFFPANGVICVNSFEFELKKMAGGLVTANPRNIKQPTFDHVNRLIAQCISSSTTSLRFETQLGEPNFLGGRKVKRTKKYPKNP